MGLRISRMINKHDKPTNVLLTAQSRSLHKADHCTMYRQHLMFGIAASLGGTTKSFHSRGLDTAATQGVVEER